MSWSDFEGARFTNVSAGYVDVETFNTAIERGATDNQATKSAAQELLGQCKTVQHANGRHSNLQTATPHYPVVSHPSLSLPPLVLQDWTIVGSNDIASQLQGFDGTGGPYNNQQLSNYPDPDLAAYSYDQQQDIGEVNQQQSYSCEPSNTYRNETNESWVTQPQSDSLHLIPSNSHERQGQLMESNHFHTFANTLNTQQETPPANWSYGNEQIYNGYNADPIAPQTSMLWAGEGIKLSVGVQTTSATDLHSTQTNHPASNNDTVAQAERLQLPDTYAGRRNGAAREKFPFECGACQKRFLYIDSAQKHHRLHHGEPTNIIQRYDAPKRPRPARPRNYKNAQAQLRRSQTPSVLNSPTRTYSTPALQNQTPDNGNSFQIDPFQLYTNEDHPLVATASPTNMDLPTIHHPTLTYFPDIQPTTNNTAQQVHHQSPFTAPMIHNSSSTTSLNASLINSPFNPQLFHSSPPSSLTAQPTAPPKTYINQLQPYLPLTPESAPDTAQQALLGFRRTAQPLQLVDTSMEVGGSEWDRYVEDQRAPMATIDPNLTVWGPM